MDIYHLSFIIALFCGWLSFLITNFFGFSVVVTQLLFFLLPAGALVMSNGLWVMGYEKELRISFATQRFFLIILVFLITLTSSLITLTWFADTNFAKGYRFSRAGKYANAYAPLTRAVRMNPFEPLYRDEYGSVLSSLSLAAAEPPEDATLAATLAASALRENERAIAISPENVTFWKTKTKILYALSSMDEQYLPRAVQALERAHLLSPNDPKIVYNLAILAGKTSDYEKAIALLLRAKELKPNYKDAYYALFVFYNEIKQKDKAKEIISEYLTTIDSKDEELQKLLQ